ncbi:MAG: archease [Pseudomonadota bacterium]
MAAPDVAWEHFRHDADIGVRGFGATPEEAFEQAALAMTAVITDPALVVPREEIVISSSAPELETLLVDWLNKLVLEMAVRRMLFGSFRVSIDDGTLTATAAGEPIDPERHEPAAEIKGATFTALEVGREADGRWRAQCVVDV